MQTIDRAAFARQQGRLGAVVPAAFFLEAKAQAGDFIACIRLVQVPWLIGGATKITLLILNTRDGMALSRSMQGNRVIGCDSHDNQYLIRHARVLTGSSIPAAC